MINKNKKIILIILILCLMNGLLFGAGIFDEDEWSGSGGSFTRGYIDPLILDVIYVNLENIRELGIEGSDVVLSIIERRIDRNYVFAYITDNYSLPNIDGEVSNFGNSDFIVAIVNYTNLNDLLYFQVVYGNQYFGIFMAKNSSDFISIGGVNVRLVNYSIFDQRRRALLRDEIKINNMIPLGIN